MRGFFYLLLFVFLLHFKDLVDGFPWLFYFWTANLRFAGYRGLAKVCVNFQSGSSDCFYLSRTSFSRGSNYTLKTELCCPGEISSLVLHLQDPGFEACKLGHYDKWHLSKLVIRNLETGKTYRTTFDPISVVPALCNVEDKLTISAFSVAMEPKPCLVSEGVYLEHGDSMEIGCSGDCLCYYGSLDCHLKCRNARLEGCRQIYVPGHCCQDYICDINADLRCPNREVNDCEGAVTVLSPGEAPWVALVRIYDGDDDLEALGFCSGVIVNTQWILTTGECIYRRNGTSDRLLFKVIVGETSVALSEDTDTELEVIEVVSSPAVNLVSSLVALRLKTSLSFDREVQPVTLPLTSGQCRQLTNPNCALSVTGWFEAETSDTDQYELRMDQLDILRPNGCDNLAKYRREDSLCLAVEESLSQSCIECGDHSETCSKVKAGLMCSRDHGNGLISSVPVMQPSGVNVIETHFLVGIMRQIPPAHTKHSFQPLCSTSKFRLATSICPYIDWIKNSIS